MPTNAGPSINLAWNASPTAGVTNYNIYQGNESGSYQSKVATGTNLSLTVNNLTRGIQTFFNVTCQAGGLESAFGGEISYTPASPPQAPAFTPIVVLVVQASPSILPLNWSTLATLSLAATADAEFYRTFIRFNK